MPQLVSRHEIESQEIGFKKFGTKLWRVVGLHQILLGTTTKLSMPVQVLELWLHLKEIFLLLLGLGLTVTEINIKKVQKQDLKTLKM